MTEMFSTLGTWNWLIFGVVLMALAAYGLIYTIAAAVGTIAEASKVTVPARPAMPGSTFRLPASQIPARLPQP